MRLGKRRNALGVHRPTRIVIVSGSIVPVKKGAFPISGTLKPDLSSELNWSAFSKIDMAYLLAFIDQISDLAHDQFRILDHEKMSSFRGTPVTRRRKRSPLTVNEL